MRPITVSEYRKKRNKLPKNHLVVYNLSDWKDFQNRKTEAFPYYSTKKKKLGLATRKALHKLKLIYKAAHVLVFNKKGELFLQKRAKTKDVYPRLFAPSASGHVNYGETPKQAALRELQEELSIKPRIWLLDQITCFTSSIREHLTVYMTITNKTIKINRKELETGYFMPLNQIYKNPKSAKYIPSLQKELVVFKKKIVKNLDKKGVSL